MRKPAFYWSTLFLFTMTIAFTAVQCKKDDDDPTPSASCTDGIQNQNETGIDCGGPCAACPITDADGNVYTTVTIGTQTWMVENLATTKYNDGTPIPSLDYGHWGLSEDGAYCNLNDMQSNADVYGRLYNWYAVETGNLAPAGFHVPTQAEWQTLIDFIGGDAVAGGKLKEVGFTHWSVPNTAATDEFGFTVLPGLWRLHNAPDLATSGENQYGKSGHFWSATPHNLAGFARHRAFNFDTGEVFGSASGDIASKAIGMSIRCIKD